MATSKYTAADDYSEAIFKWRQVDLTKWLGRRDTVDTRVNHLSIWSLSMFAVIFSALYVAVFFAVNALWRRCYKIEDKTLGWKLTSYTLS